jgi:hypothetical protein
MENFNKSYLVIGFKNKAEMATLHKDFKTEREARAFISKEIKNKSYEIIILRKLEGYIGNNDNLDISISTPIEKFVA